MPTGFLLAAALLSVSSGPTPLSPITGTPDISIQLTMNPAPAPIQRQCTWLTHEDPELMNVFFPDTQAHYWVGVFATLPGVTLRIHGEFPHARYMSFNIYGPTLGPIDGIADVEILPDAGSVNPFLPGANRNATNRKYTLTVLPQPAPTDPSKRARNTIYAGVNGLATPAGNLMYRVYVPDAGATFAGSVDLPRFRYSLAGIQIEPPDTCALLEKTRLGLGLNNELAAMNLSALPIPVGGSEPLEWHKFFNAPLSVTNALESVLGDSPIYDPVREILYDSGLRGGFLSNRDNQYVAVMVNNRFGELVALTSKLPTTPRTYQNVPVMPAGQLRYLSLCSNDMPTQRYWDCLYDEQIPREPDGDYVVVISHADQRPANARPECGVAWLNWGPLATSTLIMRHMLAAPDFAHSIQKVEALDSERQVMGAYYPFGTYSSKAEFESLSADPRGDAATCRVDATVLRQRSGAGG